MKIQVILTELDITTMLASYLSSQGVQLSISDNKEVIAKLVEVLTDTKLEAETLPRATSFPPTQYFPTYPNMPPPNTFWYKPEPYCVDMRPHNGIAGSGITLQGGTALLGNKGYSSAGIKTEKV